MFKDDIQHSSILQSSAQLSLRKKLFKSTRVKYNTQFELDVLCPKKANIDEVSSMLSGSFNKADSKG